MQNWQKHSGILCKCILSTSICLWWWALWCMFTIPGYCLPLCRASKTEVCLIRAAGVGAVPCTPSLSLSSNFLCCKSSCSLVWFTFRRLLRFVLLTTIPETLWAQIACSFIQANCSKMCPDDAPLSLCHPVLIGILSFISDTNIVYSSLQTYGGILPSVSTFQVVVSCPCDDQQATFTCRCCNH